MGALTSGPWPWLAAVVAVAVLVGLGLRYRALVRRGNTLPPGAGGGRLVGMTGVVTRAPDAHRPDPRARVTVLGDEWPVADGHDSDDLGLGDRVRVIEVEGVALRVVPTSEDDPSPPRPHAADTEGA